MTTLTITKTVDLTAMSDDTLSAQIDSNRENAQKIAQSINKAALGDLTVRVPGYTEPEGQPDTYSYRRPYLPDTLVENLAVGDLIAVKDTSGSRYSYGNGPRHGDDLTDQINRSYSGWSVYQVVGKTAKRVKVERCDLPTGYYDTYTDDNGADLYDTWGVPRLAEYGVDTWGDKESRFIAKIGTVREVQQRLAEQVEKVDRYKRVMLARKAMVNEVQRRREIAEAEAEARRQPLKAQVKAANEAAGMTLLNFQSYGADEGTVAWSYEMRGGYSSQTPSRFVMALASEVIASRRLTGKITPEQYALVLDTVKRLDGGEAFATSIDALTSEDDGTED